MHNFENFWKSCHSSILIVPSPSPAATACATPSKISILFGDGDDDIYDDSDPYMEKSFGEKYGNHLVDDSEGSVGRKTSSIMSDSRIEFRDPYEDDDDVGLIEGFRDKNSIKKGIIDNKNVSTNSTNPYRVKENSHSDDNIDHKNNGYNKSKNNIAENTKYGNNNTVSDKNRTTSTINKYEKDSDQNAYKSNRSNVSKLFGSEDENEKVVTYGNSDKTVILKSTSNNGSQHQNPYRK